MVNMTTYYIENHLVPYLIFVGFFTIIIMISAFYCGSKIVNICYDYYENRAKKQAVIDQILTTPMPV